MLFRFLAVASFFCGCIGSIGGVQWGYLGIGRGLLQSMFFLALAVIFHIWAEVWDHHQARKMRKKRANRTGTSVNSNQLVYK